MAPNLALTAAHCFDAYDASKEIRVYSGSDGTQLIGSASLEFVDPRYSDQEFGYDIALLVVDFIDGKAPSEHFTLASVETYHKMLAGVYPNRTVLSAGHGTDETGRIGEKKAAFESQLSIFPWPGYAGKLFTDHKIGGTRPGDSGGPVFIATASGIRVFGAVSGGNIFTYVDEDGDFSREVTRNAPAIPSLCLAPEKVRDQFAIDDRLCSEISSWERRLFAESHDATTRLWKLAHAIESPLLEIDRIRAVVDQGAVESFIEKDSMLIRQYLKRRLQHDWLGTFDDRDLRDRFEFALERRGIDEARHLWSSDDEAKHMRWEAMRRLANSADKSQLAACGSDICHERFRARMGGIQSDSNPILWDPITSVQVGREKDSTEEPTDIASIICSFISEGLRAPNDFSETVNIMQSLGFRNEFVGVTQGKTSRGARYAALDASNSDFEVEVQFEKASHNNTDVFLVANVSSKANRLPLFSSADMSKQFTSIANDAGFQVATLDGDKHTFYEYVSEAGGQIEVDLTPSAIGILVMDIDKSVFLDGGVFHSVFQCAD